MRSMFLAFLCLVGVSLFASEAQAQRRPLDRLFPGRQVKRSQAKLNNAAAANQRAQARVNNAAAAQLRGQRFVPVKSARFVPARVPRSVRFVPARNVVFVPRRRDLVPVRGFAPVRGGVEIRAPFFRGNFR